MKLTVVMSSFGLFVLLVVIGTIEVTTALASASLPSTLSWASDYGSVILAFTMIAAVAAGALSLFTEREQA